jgi:hypothetical protein
LAPTLTMQASLREIDRHHAQTLGVQDFHGGLAPRSVASSRPTTGARWPSSPSADLLWASWQSRRSTEGASKSSGRPSGNQDDALRDHAPCDPACACCAGHPWLGGAP